MQAPPPKDRALSGDERLTLDPLTGLRNEHLFRLRLPWEFSEACERETNAALLVVKLDNIVGLNATHGRSAGDEALRAVAHELESCRASPERSSHLLFRLGGPVFGYYIPACTASQAKGMAEELRQRVQGSELWLDRLTVSIGMVNFYEFFLREGTAEQIAELIEQVALYRLGVAEGQGGNTICDGSDVAAAAAASRPTVLLVEPDPEALELLVRALEAAELTVRVCGDGESALSFIQTTPPAVIICEALSPRLDGFTVRERLRANAFWNTIPFILISHKKSEDLVRKAVQADIRHYFRKPLSITEVVGLVTNLTRRTQ